MTMVKTTIIRNFGPKLLGLLWPLLSWPELLGNKFIAAALY
jgi:hypothetical protein